MVILCVQVSLLSLSALPGHFLVQELMTVYTAIVHTFSCDQLLSFAVNLAIDHDLFCSEYLLKYSCIHVHK